MQAWSGEAKTETLEEGSLAYNDEMTRRELLAAGAILGVRGAAAAAPFGRIDTHFHIHRSLPAVVESLRQGDWRCLSICDSRETGDTPSILPEMIAGTIKAHRESEGRLAWATTFDPRGFEVPDFAERVIAGIGQHFNQGAIAVKFWKNIGMSVRAKSGAYVLPDDPAFRPIFETVQKAGRSIVAHLAEPNSCWEPPQGGRTSEWNMVGKPGAPSKEDILSARDRVLDRFPKLRLIGCHLGSNEEDLAALAKRLDAHPNFAVDVASRVRFLQQPARAEVRQFLLKYQDRIIYGTDNTVSATAEEARVVKSLQAVHEREWNFFAQDEASQGLGLPEAVLRNIFHDNAVRWYPGIST